MHDHHSSVDYSAIVAELREQACLLGFSALGISRADPGQAPARLQAWLAAGRHGEMDYMARHVDLRSQPQQLVPGALSVISVTVDYLPDAKPGDQADQAMISRYAWGRDYHKVVRNRLQKLANWLANRIGPFGYRAFSDSAPVMEVEFATQAGLGWRGKHSLLLNKKGSWHFIGEIISDLPLPPDTPETGHCGRCNRCIDACPTGAIIAPYQVDARRCISYLTIELAGNIPEALRPLLGNRIYGCDDCQTACPWNRFAQYGDAEFAPRHGLNAPRLIALFAWTAEEFETRLAGNPIRRIGHERWLRNLAVAMGNAPRSEEIIAALLGRQDDASAIVREHVAWALKQQGA